MNKKGIRQTETWKKMEKAMLEEHFPAVQRLMMELQNSQDIKKRLLHKTITLEMAAYFFPKMTHQMNEMVPPNEIKIVNRAEGYTINQQAKPELN